MDLFLKACGAVLIGLILILTHGNQCKDLSAVLGIAVCSMVALIALEYLQPVVEFIDRLKSVGGLDDTTVRILLKSAGIGIIAELAALVCADAGSNSLGKSIQFLGSAVILWLALPLFSMLLELIQRILGAI